MAGQARAVPEPVPEPEPESVSESPFGPYRGPAELKIPELVAAAPFDLPGSGRSSGGRGGTVAVGLAGLLAASVAAVVWYGGFADRFLKPTPTPEPPIVTPEVPPGGGDKTEPGAAPGTTPSTTPGTGKVEPPGTPPGTPARHRPKPATRRSRVERRAPERLSRATFRAERKSSRVQAPRPRARRSNPRPAGLRPGRRSSRRPGPRGSTSLRNRSRGSRIIPEGIASLPPRRR